MHLDLKIRKNWFETFLVCFGNCAGACIEAPVCVCVSDVLLTLFFYKQNKSNQNLEICYFAIIIQIKKNLFHFLLFSKLRERERVLASTLFKGK